MIQQKLTITRDFINQNFLVLFFKRMKIYDNCEEKRDCENFFFYKRKL